MCAKEGRRKVEITAGGRFVKECSLIVWDILLPQPTPPKLLHVYMITDTIRSLPIASNNSNIDKYLHPL